MVSLIVAALLSIAGGALLARWARACRLGTFRRNAVFGYRTPRTLRDDGAWVAAHRAAASSIGIASGGVLAAGAAALLLAAYGLGDAVTLLISLAFLWALLCVVAGGFPAARAAKSAVREELGG
ncbi:SdpI family protein [Leucobacter komagatae]|uniref:SdpI family protein n=1 Tax=Leucobacter komagatae TaxID=55969 RepID=UPI000697E54F|nr:SdpI family protein [Leucobacter komagatae]